MIGKARLKIRSACVPSGINSESAATNSRRMGTGKSWLTIQPAAMMAVAAAAEVQKRRRTRPYRRAPELKPISGCAPWPRPKIGMKITLM